MSATVIRKSFLRLPWSRDEENQEESSKQCKLSDYYDVQQQRTIGAALVVFDVEEKDRELRQTLIDDYLEEKK